MSNSDRYSHRRDDRHHQSNHRRHYSARSSHGITDRRPRSHHRHHPYHSGSHNNETIQRLNSILKKTTPDIQMVAGHSFLEDLLGKPVPRWDRLAIGLDCDEVYPNIFIGNRGAAQNKEYLQRLGITHVLNTADGKTRDHVRTGSTYYIGTPIVYMGLDIIDVAEVRVDKYFDRAAKFIHEALEGKGKVFVHCLMGMSRSSTMVIAYMMLKLGMSAEKALKTVRKSRDCRPNYGFLRQLAHLDKDLSRSKSSHSQEKAIQNLPF